MLTTCNRELLFKVPSVYLMDRQRAKTLLFMEFLFGVSVGHCAARPCFTADRRLLVRRFNFSRHARTQSVVVQPPVSAPRIASTADSLVRVP